MTDCTCKHKKIYMQINCLSRTSQFKSINTVSWDASIILGISNCDFSGSLINTVNVINPRRCSNYVQNHSASAFDLISLSSAFISDDYKVQTAAKSGISCKIWVEDRCNNHLFAKGHGFLMGPLGLHGLTVSVCTTDWFWITAMDRISSLADLTCYIYLRSTGMFWSTDCRLCNIYKTNLGAVSLL